MDVMRYPDHRSYHNEVVGISQLPIALWAGNEQFQMTKYLYLHGSSRIAQ